MIKLDAAIRLLKFRIGECEYRLEGFLEDDIRKLTFEYLEEYRNALRVLSNYPRHERLEKAAREAAKYRVMDEAAIDELRASLKDLEELSELKSNINGEIERRGKEDLNPSGNEK